MWCEERIVGLTLIHGDNQPDTKPRVIVVAEPGVFEALQSDLELDVYPECFDYDTFVKASLAKTISTNNTIVVVSDSLSQRVAPLEAVIALVRANVILIPWKSTEEEIAALNVASCSPRPTANTLRRVIFQHVGMHELPPRFDGDDYIEEPPDAHVVSFSNQAETAPQTEFAPPTQSEPDHVSTADLIEQIYEGHASEEHNEFLPPEEIESHQQELEEETQTTEIVVRNEDEPSFLPEFFTPEKAQAPVAQTPSQPTEPSVRKDIGSFWNNEDQQKPVDSAEHTSGQWTVKTPSEPINDRSVEHPYTQSDSLELANYVSDAADGDAYNFDNFDDKTPSSFVPDVAAAPIDKNGNQQMWTMFDSTIDHGAAAQTSLSEFPDGTDHRKAISLFEPLVLCVYSPKGGVGKTSISVNMAARLAYTTRLQVCIVDLDIAFGNVGTRLGLYNPTVRELLNEPHIDGESLARNLVYDRRSGLFALLAPLRPETGTNRRKFSPAAYKKILSLLTERFDVIILDCPVELRDPLVSGFALVEAEQVVMVVNNEQATLLDARRAVEAMCRPKDSQRLPGLGIEPSHVGLVVNQKVDNVGREVDDIRAILAGGDPNHPSKQIDILSVIADDRQLWVGNANMARTVATSGENDVDQLLDDIWAKILPDEAATEFESQQFMPTSNNPLDEILSRGTENESKKKKKFGLFKKDK
jgi:MinD-like ATPase involved in chromosome partitioning or flagellar assembly